MTTATKTVSVTARVEFKADPKKVVYTVRSSDGKSLYTTFLFDGRATSCDCPARKPCYHMVQCQAKELARREAAETARCNRDLAYAAY